MSIALSYTDKVNPNTLREFVKSDKEFIVNFKGSMRSIVDSIFEFVTLSWMDPADVVRTIRSDRRLVMTGLSTKRGFARIHTNDGPQDQSDATTVEGLLDNLKSNRTIVDYARALVEEDASGKKHTMYYHPGAFALQLTTEYLEEEPPVPLLKDQETEFLKVNGLGSPIFKQWRGGLFVLPLPHGRSGISGLEDTLVEYNAKPEVRVAEPVWLGEKDKQVYPTEFQYSSDYTGLKQCNVVKTSGSDAWNHPYLAGVPGTPKVKIAVVDTGVWNTHDDLGTTEGGTGSLEARGTQDWDFANDTNKVPNDTSADGHGTAVAGVIGALSNGWGAVGVAPSCKIIPLRVDLDVDDMGTYVERADAIHYITSNVSFTDKWGKSRGKGIARLAANAGNRYIVNISWTMTGPSSVVQDAIADAEGANVLVVAAAGDTQVGGIDITQTPVYPASYPNVIRVGSVDFSGNKPSSSNFGDNVLFAPTEHYTTLPNDLCAIVPGTSISTAFVSGVAALLWSANYKGNNPDAFTKNVAQIRAILIDPNNTNQNYPANLNANQKIGRVDAAQYVSKAV